MTKQEVREEGKQQEGDPHVKSKIRALRVERARRRMMQQVPEADVVVTNPTHYAVALKYDAERMSAPRLVAKGVDQVALRIREVATQHDVPLMENPPLARALYAGVELDQEIPEEHYRAVAQIIGYVMKLKGRKLPA
jgi:flagellar biosynthetic protein FlhB